MPETAGVFERYKDRFRRVTAKIAGRDADEVLADMQREQQQVVADMRRFIETDAYKQFREKLTNAIAGAVAQPGDDVQTAAGASFRQAGLREAERIVDHMVQVAAENIEHESD